MRKNTSKVIFLTSAVLISIMAGLGFIYVFGADQTFKEEGFEGNFGSAIGIHDIVRSNEGGIDGLPATNITFKLSQQGTGDPISGLTYVGDYLEKEAKAGETELVNLKSSSENDKSSFIFEYYANSPADYMDGSYEKALNDFRTVLGENSYADLTYISKPTAQGNRSIDVLIEVAAEGGDADSTLELIWTNFISDLTVFELDGSRYNVTLTTANPEQKATITGFFYDEDTRQDLRNINSRVFSTLAEYMSATSLKLKETKYVIAHGEGNEDEGTNDNAFQLTIAGDQPEQAVINKWVDGFTKDFYNQSSYQIQDIALLPTTGITIVKYENSTEAVYISYPTNMVWK